MQRLIIINCLLLASIVSGAPDGRHKRHFSYIKDLITSTLFGRFQPNIPPFPNLDAGTDYELYRVPGFDDVLIKTTPDVSEETEVINGQGEVLKIHPFEYYIGTDNIQDTAIAFENVRNLLSTGVLNRQQSDLMQKTMAPMMSDVNTINFKAKENIEPAEIISETLQPLVTEIKLPHEANVISGQNAVKVLAEETMNTAPVTYETLQPVLTEAAVKLEVPFKPRYSYTQVVNNVPITTFTQLSPKVSIRQKVNTSPALPMCIKQRIDEVVSLGVNPHRRIAIKGGLALGTHQDFKDLHDSSQVELLEQPKHKSIKSVPLNPVIHFVQPTQVHEVGRDKNETFKSNSANVVKSVKTSAETAIKEPKHEILPHYSYQLVSQNKSQVYTIIKENNKLNSTVKNPPVLNSTPKSASYINVTKTTDNLIKSAGTTPKEQPISNYVYKQISHNNSNGFYITKEKEENNAPLPSHYGSITFIGNAPKPTNGVNFGKSTENITKEGRNEPNNKPVSNYVYKQVSHNNANTFSIAKESDEANSDSSLDNVPIPPVLDLTPTVTTSSNIKKTTDNFEKTTDSKLTKQIGANIVKSPDSTTKNLTLSQYINKELSHNNPPPFSILEKKDEVKANVNTDSPLPRNFVYIPPDIDSSPPISKHSNFEKPDHNVITKDNKPFDINIVKTAENVANDKTLSEYIHKQVTHNIPHAFSTVEKKHEVIQNNESNSLSPQYVHTSPVIGKAPTINIRIGDSSPKETRSQYVYKQVNQDNQNVFSMVQEENKLKTNIVNNSAPVTMKIEDAKDFSVERALATSSKSVIEAVTTKSLPGKPPILKENDRIYFNDNPIVVPDIDSNYVYHHNNVDGTSVSVKGNKDGVTVNVDEKSVKGRGDIPNQ